MSKKQVVGVTSDGFTTKNKNVRRLGVEIVIDTTNINAGTIPDLNKITVSAVLNQAGKDFVLFNSKLGTLLRHSNFKGSFEQVHRPNLYGNNFSGTKWLICGMIDLGGTINLKGNDQIRTEIIAGDGWFGSNATANSCYQNYEWRDDIGVQDYVPMIKTMVIPSGNGQFSESLGDNVTEVALISTLTTAVTTAAAQLTTVKINSDRYNVSDDLFKLLNRRFQQFEIGTASDLRFHCFMYQPNTELDNCQIEALLTSGNITDGSLTLVWRQFAINAQVLQRADTIREKHNRADVQKLKMQAAA